MLGIQAGRLLLYGTEGAAHGNGGQTPEVGCDVITGLAGDFFRDIEIGGEYDTIAIVEGNLAVAYQFRLRKSLVPFLGEGERVHIIILVAAEQHQGCEG